MSDRSAMNNTNPQLLKQIKVVGKQKYHCFRTLYKRSSGGFRICLLNMSLFTAALPRLQKLMLVTLDGVQYVMEKQLVATRQKEKYHNTT